MKARRRTTRPLSERRLAVLRRLVPKSQMLGDLAREMGEKHAAVESHVRELVYRGFAERLSAGRYRATKQGEAAVAAQLEQMEASS